MDDLIQKTKRYLEDTLDVRAVVIDAGCWMRVSLQGL